MNDEGFGKDQGDACTEVWRDRQRLKTVKAGEDRNRGEFIRANIIAWNA